MLEERKPRRRKAWLPIALLTLGALALASLRVGPPPEISVEAARPGIGRATGVSAHFRVAGRGLTAVKLELLQGELSVELAAEEHAPRAPWAFWGPRVIERTLTAVAGRDSIEGLREGEAILRATAQRAGTWLRRPSPVIAELRLPVRLRPPALGVLSSQHYPTQGGSEVVVYRVGETSVQDGVEVGERFFPGADLPAAPAGTRFCLYGVPFDIANEDSIRLVAVDDVDNRAAVSFVDRFRARGYESDRIELSERFMAKVVPEILANTPGLSEAEDLLASYLRINRELRAADARTLEELAAASRPAFLWSRPFEAMPNAQVMSSFADRRTYVFEGREVDQQDHLGFDLASVRRAPVPASNAGVVVLARYFGIYGNAVVVDHGYGLMSLYGHLSSIAVAEGQPVSRGQELGRSGETGLAGGDHLHFTMLLQGMAVNPMEWWDAAWIENRVAAKLGPVFQFER